MKILYDARWILLENRFDGVSRYSHELAHALAAREDAEVAWLIYDERQLKKLPPGNYVLANNPNDPLREFFSLPRTINNSGYQLVYSPFFVMGTMGRRYKLVLTIHDMIYFIHRTPPHWLPAYVRLGWWLFHLTYLPMRWQLNKANAVATVSGDAKRMLEEAQATKRPMKVVSNAVSGSFSAKPDPKRHQLRSITYMGAFTQYKNVDCLIDALVLLPDFTLHMTGKLPRPRRKELVAHMKRVGVYDRVVIYDGATDEQYKHALAQSCCGVSASKLEGFGLQILEAQAAGVPYVGADTPIFHEVAGKSALFFDPNSPEDCAKAILQMTNKRTNDSYVKKGYENITRYSWANSATDAIELCKLIKK